MSTSVSAPVTASPQAVSSNIPTDYKAQIVAYAKADLKDPYSIKSAEISGPHLGFVGLLFGGQGSFVCARFNSKNSFGAYVGVQPTIYIFNNDKIRAAVEKGPACTSVTDYQPFSELEQISN
jgi:hypothetical protein